MTPYEIAMIQLDAAKAERQGIARNLRLALIGKDPNNQAMKIWLEMAQAIEDGVFSEVRK